MIDISGVGAILNGTRIVSGNTGDILQLGVRTMLNLIGVITSVDYAIGVVHSNDTSSLHITAGISCGFEDRVEHQRAVVTLGNSASVVQTNNTSNDRVECHGGLVHNLSCRTGMGTGYCSVIRCCI